LTQTNPSPLLSQPPAAAPRPLTARVRRRSWIEPRVRAWWMLALVLMVIAGYFVAMQFARSAQDRRLINSGVRVDARVLEANQNPLPHKTYPPEERAIFKLSYQLPGREPVQIISRLKDQRRPVMTGSTLPLYVDPANPAGWTDRTEVSVVHDALVGIMLLPLAAVMLMVAVIRRMGVLRVWRTGQALQGVVVETGQTATAPLSRVVRFALSDSSDNRVFCALVPARLGALQRGDAIWLIAPSGRPQQALVVAAYAGPGQA
jgi:hypothetical protein